MNRSKETCRALVVDDEPEVRDVLREALSAAGHAALTADSAEQALEVLAEQEVEVVVTDILLPAMDGLELSRRVTEQYAVDVIVTTGHRDDYTYEDAIASGASDFVFKPLRLEELLLRIKRVLRERRLRRERLLMVENLRQMAITDGLTGLYNSRHFHEQLASEVSRAQRYGQPLSLVLFDVDHFKNFNDRYGHLEGDQVLSRVGELVRFCLRRADSAYRYGGEEFTVLLPCTVGGGAQVVAERIRTAVREERFNPGGENVQVTVSLGVTQYACDEPPAEFLRRADRAMYRSKQEGRDRTTTLFGSPRTRETE